MRARQQSILTSPNPGPNPNPNATQGSNPGLADPRQEHAGLQKEAEAAEAAHEKITAERRCTYYADCGY
eukprot:scaffold55249_cov49-Phaeocystis_antarctica.AAC.4